MQPPLSIPYPLLPLAIDHTAAHGTPAIALNSYNQARDILLLYCESDIVCIPTETSIQIQVDLVSLAKMIGAVCHEECRW